MPTWLQVLTIVFDVIKQLVWPLVVITLVYWFRSEIRVLIPKLKRAGPEGVEFESTERQQAASVSPPGELKQLPGISRTPAIERVERVLRANINQQYPHATEREDHLTRFLAEAHLVAHFERTYRIIFGSQIDGLKILNQRGDVPENEAREFFQQVQQKYPEVYRTYGYDDWLGFLLRRDLIERRNGNIVLTDIGRDFLLYMTTCGLFENKPF